MGGGGGHLERITWQLFGALDEDDFALVVSGFWDGEATEMAFLRIMRYYGSSPFIIRLVVL